MEVAVIDWKDSIFVKDDNLENINAPQWVDFSTLDESVDDEAWFCRPGKFFICVYICVIGYWKIHNCKWVCVN